MGRHDLVHRGIRARDGGRVRTGPRWVAGVSLLALVGAGLTTAPPAAAGAAANAELTPTAVGAAPRALAGSVALKPAAATDRLRFDVVLRPRDAAALGAYAQSVSTPGSASYRRFLTTRQFADTFGPTPATIAQVASALTAVGLTPGPVSSNGLILPVTTTIGKAGRALHTGFEQYRLSSGRVAEANTAAPELPAVAAHAAQAVIGLNDLLSAPGGPPRVTHPTARASLATPACEWPPSVQRCGPRR